MAQQTILIVDNDADFRGAIAAILGRAGFHVAEANDGVDALRLIRNPAERLHVLVTAIQLPGAIDGVELAAYARKFLPRLAVVLLSGCEDYQRYRPRRYAFIKKPFRAGALLNAVKDVLAP